MKFLSKGDLVYVPSAVRLYKFILGKSGKIDHFSTWYAVQKPMNLLYLGPLNSSDYYGSEDKVWQKVLFQNQEWAVKEEDIYFIRSA